VSSLDPDLVRQRAQTVRSKLPAGIADASLASLATFVAGLVAVNIFDGEDLGIYAVFFVAFTMGQLVAYQLIYVPAEIVAVPREEAQQLAIFRESIRLGIGPSFVGASAVFVAALTTAPLADPSLLLGLVVTGFLATLLSPTQDHVRRTLHIANRSWYAAAMSLTQFVVSLSVIGVLLLLDAPVAWVPFGGLMVANLVSLSFGMLLARRGREPVADHILPLSFRALAKDGRWLLTQALIPAAAAFVVANIINYLAGPTAMGYAEAARVVAQPIVVLAAGLIYPLRPRAMAAALNVDLEASLHVERLYVAMIVIGGALYIPIAGIGWGLNPMQYLVPVAYEVPGLVAATVVSNMILASIFLLTNEMMAAGRGRTLALLNTGGAAIRILVALTAGFTGAFARPLAEGAGEAFVVGGEIADHRNRYREERIPVGA
jgi:O-antigen/teichoic acid export membrane protein